jgi:hypothetical protein
MFSGDFNMIRYCHEKNNANFRFAEAEAFNECVNDMSLIELPPLDRNFTWSNKLPVPTLETLDRVFINLVWDEVLPNTTLSSLTKTTSDHVPLKIDISNVVPRSKLFRFKNYWVQAPGFHEVTASAWNCRTRNSDTSAILATKLKSTRFALKEWRRQSPESLSKKLTAK